MRLSKTGHTLLAGLLLASLVAVLLPACAMGLCGDAAGMGGPAMDLNGLLSCPYMHFPADAPAAVPQMALMLFAAAALLLFGVSGTPALVRADAAPAPFEDPPDPPGPSFGGHLRI